MLSQKAETLEKAFGAAAEWLFEFENKNLAVRRDEIEIRQLGERLILSCPTPRGWQNWTLEAFETAGEKIICRAARKLKSPAAKLIFTPRESIARLQAETRAARLKKARELAEIARSHFSNFAKIERVSLNQSNRRANNGTTARILLSLPNGKNTAVCGSVVEKTNVENLLSNAILWFSKISEKRSIVSLWLIVETDKIEKLQKLHALLRGGWKNLVKIFQLKDAHTQKVLEEIKPLNLADLWLEKPKKLSRPRTIDLSETARKIVELAPNAIDATQSKYGENLRFNGLPFARVREVSGQEKIWFGVENKRRVELNEQTLPEFADLLNNLRENRRADFVDKRNALFRAAPESWLEAVLRRDVSRLDPNLILAPVFAQFRLSPKKGSVDLLALRTDGRLVVIELKTATDREHIFQAVDYWRQIEQHRRAGNLQNLFGDLRILNAPPLVYLVAPLLSFHRDFEILAKTITPEIEIWRFDLNEDWRGGIRVARRTNFNL
jgi:hypothetical protein